MGAEAVRWHRVGDVGTARERKGRGSPGGGHSPPRGLGPQGTSPRSTPRRAASSTGRKTFILEGTGVPAGVSRSQRSQPCTKKTAGWRAGLTTPCAGPWGRGSALLFPVGSGTLALGAAWCPHFVDGGSCQLPAAGPEHRGSFCSAPNLPLAQCRLLAETLPQVCGTCCWGRGD